MNFTEALTRSNESWPEEGSVGRRHRRRDYASITVTRLRTFADLDALQADWRTLFRSAGGSNPYAAPEWLIPWAKHFVAESELDVFAVRRGTALVGVAPWYVKHRPLPRRVQLLGAGRHVELTELPQVLAAPGETRSVLRAVIGEWARQPGDWGWLELPMMADQGWFEPDWVADTPTEHGLVQHKTTRAAVVLALPRDVGALQAGLKRNLLESIHRARNRLDRTGLPWTITVHQDVPDILAALPTLAQLHGARAQAAGRRNHPDQLAAPGRGLFLADALAAMAASRQAQILTLDVAGRQVAAQLVLGAPQGSYLSLSGFDPDWWHASPLTLLQLHAVQEAVRGGKQAFNLSVGPTVSKLRWSEQIIQHPEFILCGPRRTSRIFFTGFRIASAAAAVRREARRHTYR